MNLFVKMGLFGLHLPRSKFISVLNIPLLIFTIYYDNNEKLIESRDDSRNRIVYSSYHTVLIFRVHNNDTIFALVFSMLSCRFFTECHLS